MHDLIIIGGRDYKGATKMGLLFSGGEMINKIIEEEKSHLRLLSELKKGSG